MLEELLQAIRAGGTFEIGTLAARLGTSPELVEAMLEHLQRAGHLRLHEACTEACGGCSLKQECKPFHMAGGVRLWQG